MRSRGRLMSAAIGLLGLLTLLVLVAVPAAAAKSSPKVPSLLRAQDLTGGLQQVGDTSVFSALYVQVVDSTACTETPQQINAVKTAVAASFAPPGAAAGVITVFEEAASFANARAAKAGFALLSSNASAATACPTIGFVPPSTSTPVATYKFTHVAFPKIAGGSYAYSLTGVSTPGIPSTQVTFLSGSTVAIVAAQGASAPSLTDLKTIVARAAKRLTVLMPVPTTTSTTAPKPLTVDPVASHCADEGKVVSPSSSQAATITFSNQTSQTLKIYWLDSTGARKPYGEVAPGATTNQGTFVGHYWMLADAGDHCARIASIDAATFTMAVSG